MSEARVVALLRRRTTWEIAALLAAVVVAAAAVSDARPGATSRLAFTVVPMALVAVALAAEVEHRRWLTVGGLLLAVPPVTLADLAAGHGAGAVTVLVAAGTLVAVRRRAMDPGLRTTLAAAAGFVLLALWTAAGDARSGPAPSGPEIARTTGTALRAAIVQGTERFGTGTLLVWAAGSGVVVASALLAGRRRLATLVPVAFVAYVATAWTIEWARGPVEASGGTWLVGVAIVGTTATVDLPVRDDRRLGRALISLALAGWAWGAADEASRLDRSGPVLVLAVVAPVLLAAWLWLAARGPARPRGVNVVGYFDVTSGLGERARLLAASLRAGGVPVSEWNVAGSASPSRTATAHESDGATIYDTTIAVVTALEFGRLADSHGHVLAGSRVIGYWFWELATVPTEHDHALAMVDEVWAPTTFVAAAYRRVTDKPVRLVPLPILEPSVPAHRADASGSEGADGATVFLTSFDHLSVMERKNPLGVIEAFRQAFPTGDEPTRLVVKTINAASKPAAASALATAAAADDRIVVRDVHLDDHAHAALVRDADAFVSLHRSEGLGLHLGDAMWLGTPVIASAYGGSMDLLDDGCARLIPVRMVPVVDGDGAYPPGAMWADPDLDAAAAAMRAVVAEPDAVAVVARRAQAKMRSQPPLGDVGRSLRRVLGGWVTNGRPMWTDRSSVGRGLLDSVATMRRSTEPTDLVGGGPA